MSNDESDNHVEVGDHLSVIIEAIAAGGDGIARVSGFTVFVPGGAPGDEAEIEITQVTKNFARGRLLRLEQPSVDRVPTNCPLADSCPGCQLQHLRYEAQLKVKEQFVRDGLERIGHLHSVTVHPTIGMEHPWEYRNKGEFVAEHTDDGIRLGYRDADGKGFVPLPDCPIQHPLSMRIVHAVEEIATLVKLPLAQLITRVSPSENTALAVLVCWEESDQLAQVASALQTALPEVVGVLWSRVRGRSIVRRTLAEPIIGCTSLVQQLGDWQYTVSAESFFQVNNIQATRLLELALGYTGEMREDIFLDAYCGVGTFLLPLCGNANRSLGIEEHPVALRDAQENLGRYALHNAKLYEGRVEVILSRLLRKNRAIDVALLDPPRKGAGRMVLEHLAALKTNRIILVSCDPATLGRDTGDLSALGYQIVEAQPVDLFPQTWHVETIALAIR